MRRDCWLMSAWACLIAGVCVADVAPVTAERENAWREDRQLYKAGLREAEQFRANLLRVDAAGMTRAELVARAIHRFPEMCASALHDRPNLKGFHVTAGDFLRQIRGCDTLNAERVFGRFTGRWYGVWDRMRVDHHWQPVQHMRPPLVVDSDLPPVVARQFAWIGDGFCWHYVIALGGDPARNVILAMVYHVDASDPTKIRMRRPHVAYCAGPGKLIWVTSGEVFFEEVLRDSATAGLRYAITGFRYEVKGEQLASKDGAFQAVYTRDKNQRPPWFRFPLDLRVGRR